MAELGNDHSTTIYYLELFSIEMSSGIPDQMNCQICLELLNLSFATEDSAMLNFTYTTCYSNVCYKDLAFCALKEALGLGIIL